LPFGVVVVMTSRACRTGPAERHPTPRGRDERGLVDPEDVETSASQRLRIVRGLELNERAVGELDLLLGLVVAVVLVLD
jgi:hypothetical protein